MNFDNFLLLIFFDKILVHDCLPSTLSSQAVPRYKMLWHGDVWKAIVDLRRSNNIEIFTCLIDF